MSAPVTSLKFDLRAIREQGGLVLAGPLAVELDLARAKPAVLARAPELELEFSVGGNRVLLQGRLRGAWTLACGRCLAEHESPFSASLEETYPLEAGTVDVSADAGEAMILEIPQRSLCRPDCRGLCPQCGKNLNAAACGCRPPAPSPFHALKKLKEK